MLSLLLFILPGFYSIIHLISKKNGIRKIGADYWIFLSIACLLSLGAIGLSQIIYNLLELLFLKGLEPNWQFFKDVHHFYTTYISPIFHLEHKVLGIINIPAYGLSFCLAALLSNIEKIVNIIESIDGTEEVDKFLEPLILEEENNTAMITLTSGKVFIGPIIAGDVHKKIDYDSITIIPLLSGFKKDGKLTITTTNLNITLNNNVLKLNPIYEDLKNNIAMTQVNYISKFVMIAFCKYVHSGSIDWGTNTQNFKDFFALLHELLENRQED